MSIRVGGNVIGGNIGTDLLATKTDLNLSNSTAITNCITEIPQDIKLELDNGTLTLKAGSKVYVPNGANNYDLVITETDYSADISTYSGLYMLAVNRSTGSIAGVSTIQNCISGATAPSSPTALQGWYDTTNNIIKRYSGGSEQTSLRCSFPLCSVTSNGTTITSIDQVFNGFGYIGSTVFALPGVKGLIPNGRNVDGSLNNIEYTTSNVILYTDSGNNSTFNIVLSSWNTLYPLDCEYDSINNIIKYLGDNAPNRYIIGKTSFSSGKITSFTTKAAFHALDYNDSSTISGWSMPSSKYIDLTLGASGISYTAPANGWFYISKETTGAQYVEFVNLVSGFSSGSVYYSTFHVVAFIPARKGDAIQLNYNAGGTLNAFRFYYAEGENV